MSVALDISEDLNTIKCIECFKELPKEESDSFKQTTFNSVQINIDTELKNNNFPSDMVNIINGIACSKCKMLKEKHELRFKQMYSKILQTEKDEEKISKIKELSNNYTWSYKGHHESNSMHCGQSCLCCRALMGADFGMCDICIKYQ